MDARGVVGIVGLGNVGTAAAYATFATRVAHELVLVDANRARAEGEALDLQHGQAIVGRATVRAGGWEDLAGASVVMVSAGVGQRPGETRMDLLQRNAEVLRDVAAQLDAHCPDAVVLVATNPVDVLTYALQETSRRPRGRVLGTGTMLDTARLRAALGAHFGVSPQSIHAYVLGEHGDSELPAWSNAMVGGVPLRATEIHGKRFDAAEMSALFDGVRDAAYRIIERKGYTNLAIGLVLARLAEVILRDQKQVLPVSVRLTGEYGIDGVCLSIPCVVGKDGVEETVPPPLDDDELAAVRRSAALLKDRVGALRLEVAP